MDIRQLRYFASIVEHGSFSRAAEHLRIAQPSLSQHVSNLEGELGVQLLVRSPRGIVPTEAGTRLMGHARDILERMEQVKRDVQETADGQVGNVVLGMPEKYSSVLTVPVVERAEAQFPRINLRIIENMTGNLLEWVLNGKIDLAILIQVQRDERVEIEPIVSEDLFLVGPLDSPLRARDRVPITDLAGLPLILPSKEHGLRILADESAARANLALTIKTEIDAIPAIKSILRMNGGYTLLSEIACIRECRDGDLWAARVVDPTITQTAVMAHLGRAELSKPAANIKDLVFAVVRDLIESGSWPGAKLAAPA